MESEPSMFYAFGHMVGWWLIFLLVVPWLAVLLAAYHRGNSIIVAGLIGLFGTPLIGMLYVIAQPVNQEVREARDIRSGTKRRCSKCMTLKDPKAHICPQCKTMARLKSSPEPGLREPTLDNGREASISAGSYEYDKPDEDADEDFQRRMRYHDS